MKAKIFLISTCLCASLWATTAQAETHGAARDCVQQGPCDLGAAMAALPLSVRESHVFFTNGGAVLDEGAQSQLTLLAGALASPVLANTCLRLEGHADPGGPEDINLQISWLRAQAVYDFLHGQLGENAPMIELAAYGEAKPMLDLPKGSVLNRRVALQARDCPMAIQAKPQG